MQKIQRCKASILARESARCVDQEKVAEPDDELQLRSSTDQKSNRQDQRVVLAAPSNSNSESMIATQLPLHGTPDSDQGARRSLRGRAEIRSRPHITKASVWFLRTTS